MLYYRVVRCLSEGLFSRIYLVECVASSVIGAFTEGAKLASRAINHENELTFVNNKIEIKKRNTKNDINYEKENDHNKYRHDDDDDDNGDEDDDDDDKEDDDDDKKGDDDDDEKGDDDDYNCDVAGVKNVGGKDEEKESRVDDKTENKQDREVSSNGCLNDCSHVGLEDCRHERGNYGRGHYVLKVMNDTKASKFSNGSMLKAPINQLSHHPTQRKLSLQRGPLKTKAQYRQKQHQQQQKHVVLLKQEIIKQTKNQQQQQQQNQQQQQQIQHQRFLFREVEALKRTIGHPHIISFVNWWRQYEGHCKPDQCQCEKNGKPTCTNYVSWPEEKYCLYCFIYLF